MDNIGNCIICGKEFKKYRYNQITCSDKECKLERNRRERKRKREAGLLPPRPSRAKEAKKRKPTGNQDLIAQEAIKAREIGLDYGQYIAYKESGYLEHYIRLREESKASGNQVEKSWIGGHNKVAAANKMTLTKL